MKKNFMMRAASVLLVAVMLTTCAISGTFAKYVTSTESMDYARVANWGFEPVAMDIKGLFANVYAADSADAEGDTVNALVDVIAPGTTGSDTFAFAYDQTNGNAPEVDYTFVVSTEGSSCHADIQNNKNIQWKLDNGEWGTWDQFITAIEALDEDEYFNAGELPAGFGVDDNVHTVSWQWIFENDAEGDGTVDNDNEKDTDMGNANFLADVKLVITITATQVD